MSEAVALRDTARLRLVLVAALVVTVTMCGCDPDRPDVAGSSHQIGDQFVIINYRFARKQIKWVAVRNFANMSTPEERLRDTRVVLGPDGQYRILQTDASGTRSRAVSLLPVEPRLYFFQGDQLVTFPIHMTEEQLGDLENSEHASYDDLLKGFRQYEVKPTTAK
jgi:hypothetical protein